MATANFKPVAARRGPRIPAGVVRVSKSGADLVIPFEIVSQLLGRPYDYHKEKQVLAFTAAVDAERSALQLTPQESGGGDWSVWCTSPRSRSVLLTCRSLLSQCCGKRSAASKDYPVAVKDGRLVVSFARGRRVSSR